MKMPKVILFDMDGTLLDNSSAVVDAYRQGLIKYKYPVKSPEYIASLAGLSTFETARKIGFKEDELHLMDEFFWQYFNNYADDPNKMPEIFQDTKRVLDFCASKNIKMGIVTSNESRVARKLFAKLNIEHYFSTYIGAEDVKETKPSPEPIITALTNLQVNIEDINKKSVYFVGDSGSDVLAARAAGIYSIGIPVPHTKDTMVALKPDLLLNSLDELLIALQS